LKLYEVGSINQQTTPKANSGDQKKARSGAQAPSSEASPLVTTAAMQVQTEPPVDAPNAESGA